MQGGSVGVAADTVAAVDTIQLLGVTGIDGSAHREPVHGRQVHAGAEGITLEILADVGTLVVQETHGGIGTGAVVTEAGGQGVFLGDADPVRELGPVGVDHLRSIPVEVRLVVIASSPVRVADTPTAQDVRPGGRVHGRAAVQQGFGIIGDRRLIGTRADAGVVLRPAAPLDRLCSGHGRQDVINLLQRKVGGIIQGEAALAALLRGDQHDTVTTLGAVNSRRGSILEDVDGLNVLGVQHIQADAVGNHAVDDDQRVGTGINRVGTADLDGTRGTRTQVRRGNDDTRSLALQGFDRVVDRVGSQLSSTDRHHGTGNIALFHGTVTDDDRLLQERDVFDQRDGHDAGGRDRRGHVTDARDLQSCAGGDIQREVTVHIRDSTIRRTLDHDAGSDDRFAIGIDDLAADRALGERLDAGQQQSHHRQR